MSPLGALPYIESIVRTQLPPETRRSGNVSGTSATPTAASGRDGGDDDGLTGDVGNLFVEDLASGRRTQLTDLELSRAWWWYLSPSFTPDGRNVIFHLPRGRSETTEWDAWSVPVAGGGPTLVLRNAAFPMYFADGKEIAFVPPAASNFEGHSIAIASADGEGSRRMLVEAGGPIWLPTMSPEGSRIAYVGSAAPSRSSTFRPVSPPRWRMGKLLGGSTTTRSS